MATIKVTVHEARDLPVMDRNSGLADSYVVLRFSSTDQSTDICWRTRHPVWESTYRFDVPDLLALQEEPLEVRVFDHDVISRDDIIGSIYLDCNSIIDRGEETALSGWFPLYDLEDGMRGDLRLTIKVKFHTTHNPFAPQLPERFVRLLKVQPDAQTNHRTAPSSNPLLFLDDNYDPVAPLRVQHPTLSSEEEGVYMFAASRLDPSVYRVESTFTMVEELIVTADPDNARLTNFKSSRTRSEARALQLYRLSGKVRRQLARKVVEMKCNAILGLTENFDIEPGCLVVRAYGTPVVLSKVKYIQESKTQRWWKRHAAHLLRGGISGQSNAIAKYPIAAPAESTQNSSFNSRESDPSHAFNGTGNKTKKPVSRAATATPDSFHPAPANPTSVAHSEDGPLPPASVEDGRGSVAPIGSGVLSGVRTSSTDLISLEVLAGNFSLVFNPSVVGGIAPTQGIHLDPTLFSSTSAEDITASNGTPLLMPAPSVTAATAPSMTAVPTVAAVVAQPQRKSVMILTIKDLPSGCIQHLGGYISVRSVKIISKAKSKIMISQERDAWWMEVREELRVNCRAMHCNTILNYREEAQFCEDVVILLLSGTAAMVDHGLLPLRVGPDQLFRKAKESIEGCQDCRILHLYHGKDARHTSTGGALPFSHGHGDTLQHATCQVCHHHSVPEVLLASCSLPLELQPETPPRLMHATVSKPKKRNSKGVELALSISQALPYIEFTLHRQLIFQLRLAKLNACFGIKVEIVVGPEVIVGSLIGTGFRLAGLPLLSSPKLEITDRSIANSDVVMRLRDVIDRQRRMQRRGQHSSSSSSSTNSSSSEYSSDEEESSNQGTPEYPDEYSFSPNAKKKSKGKKRGKKSVSGATTPSNSSLSTPVLRNAGALANTNEAADLEERHSWVLSSDQSSFSSSNSSDTNSDDDYYYQLGDQFNGAQGDKAKDRRRKNGKRGKGDFIVSIDDLEEADMYTGTLDECSHYESSVLLTTPYVPDHVNNFDRHEAIVLTRRYAILSGSGGAAGNAPNGEELVYGGSSTTYPGNGTAGNAGGVGNNERGLSTRMFNQCCADAKRAFVQLVCRIAMRCGSANNNMNGTKNAPQGLKNIDEVRSFIVERFCVTNFKFSIRFDKTNNLTGGPAGGGAGAPAVGAAMLLNTDRQRHRHTPYDVHGVMGGNSSLQDSAAPEAKNANSALNHFLQSFEGTAGGGSSSVYGGEHSLLYLRLEGLLLMSTDKGKRYLLGLEDKSFKECLRYAKEDISSLYYQAYADPHNSSDIPNTSAMTATTSNTENVSTNGAAGGTTAIAAGGNLIHRKTILYHTYFRLFRNVTAPFSLAYVMEYNLHKINGHPNAVCHPHTPGTANTNASFGSVKHNNSAEGSLNASLVGNSNFLDLYSLSTNSQRLSLPTRNYYSFYNNTNSGNSVSNKKKNMSKTTVGEKLESIGQSVVEWVGRKTNMLNINNKANGDGTGRTKGEEGSSVSPSTYVATNLHQHYTPPHTEHPSHGDASPDHNHHNTNNNNTPHSRASPYVSHYTAQLPPLRTTVVHCTPLDYVSGRAIVRYLGYLSQHCVREITNVSTASEQSKCITKVEFEMQTLMSSWVLLLGGNTLLNHEIIYHEISFSEASGGTCFVFATVRGDAALTSNQVRSAVATSINAAATTGLPQEESDYESSSSMSSASDRDE